MFLIQHRTSSAFQILIPVVHTKWCGRKLGGRPQRIGRDQSIGRSRSRSKKGDRRSDVPKKRTALAEHTHHVGSARNASDCIAVTNFLVNHIKNKCADAGDIGEALQTGVEPDWQALQLTLEISKVDQTAGENDTEKAQLQKKLERDKERFAKNGTWHTRLLVEEKPITGKTRSRKLRFCGDNPPPV